MFESARRVNTIFSYHHFLKRFPATEYRNEVFELVKNLKKNWHPAMRDVRTVQPTIEESFPEGYRINKERITGAVGRIFQRLPIDVVSDDVEKADALLQIKIKGEALKGYYTGNLNGTHYTGAIVSGSITLKRDIREIFSFSFYHKRSLAQEISREYPKPGDAPFYGAFEDSGYDRKLFLELREICQLPPALLWKDGEKDLIFTSPTVVDGTVYVGSKDDNIYALDASSGLLKWRFLTSSGPLNWRLLTGEDVSKPVISNDKVYVSSDDGWVYAFKQIK
ncbi:MAG: PQQ-binding-like beta-propeller repeat protein [Bacteroidota bacterium]|nr:PQQ-binding-like beta-propeller repeat protein [Bacteroidota bacterium]